MKKAIVFKPNKVEEKIDKSTKTAFILLRHVTKISDSGEEQTTTTIMRVFETEINAYTTLNNLNNNKLMGRNTHYEIVLAPYGDLIR